MLTSHKIFTEAEIKSRYEITLENYCKTVNIEALTMIDMAKKEILPAIESYIKELSKTISLKQAAVPGSASSYEKDTVKKLSVLTDEIYFAESDLESAVLKLKDIEDVGEESRFIRDDILDKMAKLRVPCDEAETLTASKYWPFPTYGELLFGVK